MTPQECRNRVIPGYVRPRTEINWLQTFFVLLLLGLLIAFVIHANRGQIATQKYDIDLDELSQEQIEWARAVTEADDERYWEDSFEHRMVAP